MKMLFQNPFPIENSNGFSPVAQKRDKLVILKLKKMMGFKDEMLQDQRIVKTGSFKRQASFLKLEKLRTVRISI